MLCQQGEQEAGRENSQDSWQKLATGIFHNTEHHAQCINWGNLARRDQLLPGDELGIGQGVVSNNCILHHVFPSVLVPFHRNYYYILFCFNYQTVFTPLMLPYPASAASLQQEFGTGTAPHLPCHHFMESHFSLLEDLHFSYSNNVLQEISIIQRA